MITAIQRDPLETHACLVRVPHFVGGILILITLTTPFFWNQRTLAEDKATSAQKHTPGDQHDAQLHAHWAYRGIEGPEHWGMLGQEYAACEKGSEQSPVNIHAPEHGHGQENLAFHYRPTHVHVANNGHAVQVDYNSRSILHVNNRIYLLRQFHFHAPSEHEIEGSSYPMEVHLVHQDPGGHIVVVGIFVRFGERNLWIARIWEWIPQNVGQTQTPLTMNVADLLPANTQHYSYRGSLTTPPCSEGVQWILLKEPIQISEEQRQQFVTIIGENARPVQPLQERQVQEY